MFSLSNSPKNFLFYLFALNIFYPLMLISQFTSRKTKTIEGTFSIILIFVTYCFYFYIYEKGHIFYSLLIGLLFLLQIIPLFLISYSEILHIKLSNFKDNFLNTLFILILIIGLGSEGILFLFKKHIL